MKATTSRRDFMKRTVAAGTAPYLFSAHALPRGRGSSSVDPPKPRIEPFDYRGVQLREGMLRKQFLAARDFFYSIPDDNILIGFRRRAGLPAPGNDLPGLYGKDIWNTFGQWLSGMARASCATGDAELRAKASRLVTEWAKAISPDGYFYYSRSPTTPHYTYEKTVCGLIDMYEYAGDSEALVALERITDWAIGNLDRSRKTPNVNDGTAGGSEWYTLSENLYRAYQATGKAKYRSFGDLWHYTNYWESFADGSNPAPYRLHAYSHVNTLSSLAMTYAMTGDTRYLRELVNAHDYLLATQCYATGGFGPAERLVAPDGSLGESLETVRNTFETPCGSWAVFKLCRYLMRFTGEARFGNWMEKIVYNGIGAALPMKEIGLIPYGQNTFYYADYTLGGGQKTYRNVAYPCCAGTYIQAVADYHNLIYYHDQHGLYVNLFVPSQLTWDHDGMEVKVEQETSYPESDTTTLTIRPAKTASFNLKFRVPGWTEGATAEVNGTPQAIAAKAGRWAMIARTWNPGDRVTIHFPMRLMYAPVDKQHPHRVALTYGPVVLVQQHQSRLIPSGSTLEDWIQPNNRALEFHITAQAQRAGLFEPYYRVGADTAYAMYFDLET